MEDSSTSKTVKVSISSLSNKGYTLALSWPWLVLHRECWFCRSCANTQPGAAQLCFVPRCKGRDRCTCSSLPEWEQPLPCPCSPFNPVLPFKGWHCQISFHTIGSCRSSSVWGSNKSCPVRPGTPTLTWPQPCLWHLTDCSSPLCIYCCWWKMLLPACLASYLAFNNGSKRTHQEQGKFTAELNFLCITREIPLLQH